VFNAYCLNYSVSSFIKPVFCVIPSFIAVIIYADKQSENGKIGQFWKKAKLFLSAKELSILRKQLENYKKEDILSFFKDDEISKATLQGLLKHLVIVIENVNEDVNTVKSVVIPYDSENFKNLWAEWKDYKKREHKFNYASPQSEQASLTELANLSNGLEETALKIIQQSMAKGWKGFFAIKTENNGNGFNNNKPPTGSAVDSVSAFEKLSRFNN